jgi:hypothetical protein
MKLAGADHHASPQRSEAGSSDPDSTTSKGSVGRLAMDHGAGFTVTLHMAKERGV